MPLERIRESTPTVREAARALYEASLSDSERVDFERLAERDATDEQSPFLVLHDGDGQVQALCVATHLSYPAAFIQYFILAEEQQEAAVAAFLNDCIARLLVPPFEGIALQIQRPEAAPDDADRRRRHQLWVEHSAEAIIDRVLIPNLDGDGTFELSLLWIHPPGGDDPFPYVVAYQVLAEVYGIEDATARHLMERSGMRWHG